MTQRHKHADLIIAWANGAKVEYRDMFSANPRWAETVSPYWDETMEYRIKQNLPEGYTAHDGGWCPVDEDCSVQVLFRDARGYCDTGLAKHWSWRHTDSDYDIIGYRVLGKKKPIVRWQWIVRWGNCALPIIPNVFYTEAEIEEAYKGENATIIGKAEWTRMEFEE